MRGPSVPWFEADDLEDRMRDAGLDDPTAQFVRDLARDGYAAVDLGDEARRLCDRAVAETEGYFTGPVRRAQNAWMASPAVRALALWRPMRDLLRVAYGREPFPFQTLNFQPASEQGIHLDTLHFHCLPERFMCGVWIALEDVRDEAGPLVYYPGSHRLPAIPVEGEGMARDPARQTAREHRHAERLARQLEGLSPARAILPKGWAFVWAANLAHGGSPILDPNATRRSLVVHHYFEDCLYFTPVRSDEASGQLDVRLPQDLRTGMWRWPRRDGRRVWPGARAVAGAIYRRARGRPLLG